MISYFMKMMTETDATNCLPSNVASFVDSKQTDISDIIFLSNKKKRTIERGILTNSHQYQKEEG